MMPLREYLEIKRQKLEEWEHAGKPKDCGEQITSLIQGAEQSICHIHSLNPKQPIENYRNHQLLVGVSAEKWAKELKRIVIPKSKTSSP